MTLAQRIRAALHPAEFARGGGGAKSSKAKGKGTKGDKAKKAKGAVQASKGGACCKTEGGKFGPGNNYGSLNKGSAKASASRAKGVASRAAAKASVRVAATKTGASPASAIVARSRLAASKAAEVKASRDREAAVAAQKVARNEKARERRAAKKEGAKAPVKVSSTAADRAPVISRMVGKSRDAAEAVDAKSLGRPRLKPGTRYGDDLPLSPKTLKPGDYFQQPGGLRGEITKVTRANVEFKQRRADGTEWTGGRVRLDRLDGAYIQRGKTIHMLDKDFGKPEVSKPSPPPAASIKATGRNTPERDAKAAKLIGERIDKRVKAKRDAEKSRIAAEKAAKVETVRVKAEAFAKSQRERVAAEKVAKAKAAASGATTVRASREDRTFRILEKAGYKISDSRRDRSYGKDKAGNTKPAYAAERKELAAKIKRARAVIAKVDTQQQAKLKQQREKAAANRAKRPMLDLARGDRAAALKRLTNKSRIASGKAGAEQAWRKEAAKQGRVITSTGVSIGGRAPDLRRVAPAGKTTATARTIEARKAASDRMVRASREAAQGAKMVATKRAARKASAATKAAQTARQAAQATGGSPAARLVAERYAREAAAPSKPITPVKPPPAAVERRPITDPVRIKAEAGKADQAFDRAPGAKDNFVRLSDMRKAMPHLSRDEFDTLVMKELAGGKYSVTQHEGAAANVPKEVFEGGISAMESGGRTRLAYISRMRDDDDATYVPQTVVRSQRPRGERERYGR